MYSMNPNDKRKIIILTGAVHSGKSGALLHWVQEKSVGGFVTPTINEKKVLLNVDTKISYPYEVDGLSADAIHIGKYFLDNRAFHIAAAIVEDALSNPLEWFVFDEIGKLELAGMGHYHCLKRLLGNWQGKLLLVIRDQLVNEVMSTFKLNEATLINKQNLQANNF